MSRKFRITDSRKVGLVEITVDERRRVILSLYPPGREPVELPMEPQQARDLAHGLLAGADEAWRNEPVTGIPDA